MWSKSGPEDSRALSALGLICLLQGLPLAIVWAAVCRNMNPPPNVDQFTEGAIILSIILIVFNRIYLYKPRKEIIAEFQHLDSSTKVRRKILFSIYILATVGLSLYIGSILRTVHG